MIHHDKIQAYICQGFHYDSTSEDFAGLNEISQMALEKKRIKDEEIVKATGIIQRRRRVDEWASVIGLSSALYSINEVVSAYIYDDVGNEETVSRACRQEKDALETRRRESSKDPEYRARRRAEVIQELRTHGLTLRPEFRFCDEYITGETSASVEQVVATMKLTQHLLEYSDSIWSSWHNTLEVGTRRMMWTGEVMGWYDACKRVIQESRTQIIEYGYDSDNEFDYTFG